MRNPIERVNAGGKQAAGTKGLSAETGSSLRTFTSWKLDIQFALICDRRVSFHDRAVAVRLLHGLNQENRVAIASDAMLADDLGTDRKRLYKARVKLRELGWITYNEGRSGQATQYRFVDTNVNMISDRRIVEGEAREEARSKRAAARRDINEVPVPHRRPDQRGTRTAISEVRVPPIHLQTPSQDSQGEEAPNQYVDGNGLEPSRRIFREPSDAEVAQADFDERAAILEYDGGHSRPVAEELAAAEFEHGRPGTYPPSLKAPLDGRR